MPSREFPTPLPHIGSTLRAQAWVLPPHQPAPAPLHPLLSGDPTWGPNLSFDLASHTFSPRYATRSEVQTLLDELSVPATYPPVHRIIVTCDRLPQWPITIDRRVGTTFSTADPLSEVAMWTDVPVTAYEVLMGVQCALHIQLSAADWDNLTRHEQRLVMDAYTRRCRRVAGTRWLDTVFGVRRVDCLGHRYMFRGLIMQSIQGGVAYLNLVVGRRTTTSDYR